MKIRRLVCALSLFVATISLASAGGMIDNPEYGYWKGFGAGSSVTHKSTSDFGYGKQEQEMTTTLTAITAEKATVEMAMGATKMPARDILAKVEDKSDPNAKPAAKPEEGDEEIEVGGKKMKCHWVKTHTEANGMVTDAQSWMCSEIPGHLAKSESKMSGSMKGSSSMVATKWEKK